MYTVNENSARKLAETFDQIFALDTSTDAKDVIIEYKQNQLVKSDVTPFGLDSVKLIVVGSDSAKSKEYMYSGPGISKAGTPPGSCSEAENSEGAGKCKMVEGVSFPLKISEVHISSGKFYEGGGVHVPIGVDVTGPCGKPLFSQFFGMAQINPIKGKGEAKNWKTCKTAWRKSACTNILRIHYGCNLYTDYWHVLDEVPEWSNQSKNLDENGSPRQKGRQCTASGVLDQSPANFKIPVENGGIVKPGEIVAYMGSSRNSSGPHLHYTITFENQYRYPLEFSWTSPEVLADMREFRQSRGKCVFDKIK